MSVTVEKCLQAWTNSLKQMNAKADIVFFGDSLIYYGDFASAFPDKVVCNLGLRGDTMQGMIDRVEQLRQLNPETIYLMAGINDVSTIATEEFGNLYESLVLQIRKALPDSSLILQTMLPVNDRDFSISVTNKDISKCNEVIGKIAIKYELRQIQISIFKQDILPKNFTSDGIHINKEVYNRWYEVLQKDQLL